MQHATIVETLGFSEIAAAVGLSVSRVRRWRKDGIPAARWTAVADLARRSGRAAITLDALAAGARDRRPVPPLRRGRKPAAKGEAVL